MKNIEQRMYMMMMDFAPLFVSRFESQQNIFLFIRSRLGTLSNRGDHQLSDALAEELSQRFSPFTDVLHAHRMVIFGIARSAPVRFDTSLLEQLLS